MRFTDRQIRNLKHRTERFEVWESRGLGLRVSPAGRKTWVFVYHFEGRSRRMSFGTYPVVTVAQSHEMHGKALADLERGIDPGTAIVRQRKDNREAITIGELIQDYLELHCRPNKRSWRSDQTMFDREVLPRWRHRKVKDIARRDVILLLDSIKGRGSPVTANRVRSLLHSMFNWGLGRDMVPQNPCLGVPRPATEDAKDRVLETAELEKLWRALDTADRDLLGTALQLVLATAQRPGEVLGARWSEIDLEAKWWRLPGDRTKNGREHRIPLSSLVLRLLARARFQGIGSDLVFASPRGKKALTRQALARRMAGFCRQVGIPPASPHDLRRTAASHMTATGISRLVVSKILNHSDPSVTGIYDRFSYDPEKQAALDCWARQLDSISHMESQTA